MSIKLSEDQEKVLYSARKTYGPKNQLAVVAEECNELAIAVLKFLRYSDEERGIDKTYANVLEERADLEIVLRHLDAIYGFVDSEIKSVVDKKVKRLQHWLDVTSDTEYTTVFRSYETKEKNCDGCFLNNHYEEGIEEGQCLKCKKERNEN